MATKVSSRKIPKAPYSPGKRGKSWIKLKGVMPTLDCVVVAAEQGHGKRSDVLSDYTFAVRRFHRPPARAGQGLLRPNRR